MWPSGSLVSYASSESCVGVFVEDVRSSWPVRIALDIIPI